MTGVQTCALPISERLEAWRRLASDLDPARLADIITEVGFDDIIGAAQRIVDGGIRGRLAVAVS